MRHPASFNRAQVESGAARKGVPPAADEDLFIGRCQSLPDRLIDHLAAFDKTEVVKNLKMVRVIARTMRIGESPNHTAPK